MTTKTMKNKSSSKRQLTFGLGQEVPDEATAAWGARWIYPDQMLPDRQSFEGMKTPDGENLKNWLNGGALEKAMKFARKSGGKLHPTSHETVVLYEDNTGVIKGNPNASGGYLYVCAYLQPKNKSNRTTKPKATVSKKTNPIFNFSPKKCEACEGHNYSWTLSDNYGVTYKVCTNCLLDLVETAMSKKQFKNMLKNGHSDNEFLLHGDFYDNRGNAEQPKH